MRTDLLREYSGSCDVASYGRMRRGAFFILALDFHSISDKWTNRSQPAVNWKNNRAFYTDLIKLAQRFPEVYIIIRGKMDNWIDIPYFREVYSTIEKLDNIAVDREYSQMHTSYKLAAAADAIVARPTSLADECLAMGKRVFIADYYQNSSRWLSGIYDYAQAPVFVHSYEDLEERIERLLLNGDYMDEKVFSAIREDLFGSFCDGATKRRLQDSLVNLFD